MLGCQIYKLDWSITQAAAELLQECGCLAEAFVNDDPFDEFHDFDRVAALLGSEASLRSFRRARADCSAMPCSTSCTSCRYRMGTNRFCRHSWARSTSALAWLPSVFSCSGHKWPAASSISARAACRNPERSFLSAASWQVDHVERPCASTASSGN